MSTLAGEATYIQLQDCREHNVEERMADRKQQSPEIQRQGQDQELRVLLQGVQCELSDKSKVTKGATPGQILCYV